MVSPATAPRFGVAQPAVQYALLSRLAAEPALEILRRSENREFLRYGAEAGLWRAGSRLVQPVDAAGHDGRTHAAVLEAVNRDGFSGQDDTDESFPRPEEQTPREHDPGSSSTSEPPAESESPDAESSGGLLPPTPISVFRTFSSTPGRRRAPSEAGVVLPAASSPLFEPQAALLHTVRRPACTRARARAHAQTTHDTQHATHNTQHTHARARTHLAHARTLIAPADIVCVLLLNRCEHTRAARWMQTLSRTCSVSWAHVARRHRVRRRQ